MRKCRAAMRVPLRREENALASRVRPAISIHIGMPMVPAKMPIRGVKKEVALLLVLTDEQNEGRGGSPTGLGVLPPGGQESIIPDELVEVLVDASCAVVLDEDEPALGFRCLSCDLQYGVGIDRTNRAGRESLDRPVVIKLCAAWVEVGWRIDRRLAFP